MRGRIQSVAVGASSVELCKRNLARRSLILSVGDSANSSSVILKDNEAATATNGFPIVWGQEFHVDGEMATHQFFAIRLAAVNCVVGIVEGFDDDFEEVAEAAAESLPTIES